MSKKYFILISLGINAKGGCGTPQGKIENVVIYTFKKICWMPPVVLGFGSTTE